MWATKNSLWRRIFEPSQGASSSLHQTGTRSVLSSVVDESVAGWRGFIDELQTTILPVYERHERSFDGGGVHGRMHICRSVLFAEYMTRFYRAMLSQNPDSFAVRVATAFHDSGRRGNGQDLWENESAKNCEEYVRQRAVKEDAGYAEYVAGLILKKRERNNLEGWIVYDADVLEIMRPCCGHGGLNGFRREFLHFAGQRDALVADLTGAVEMREELINEAWRWIEQTEKLKPKLARSRTYFLDVLDYLSNKRRKFPLLAPLASG